MRQQKRAFAGRRNDSVEREDSDVDMTPSHESDASWAISSPMPEVMPLPGRLEDSGSSPPMISPAWKKQTCEPTGTTPTTAGTPPRPRVPPHPWSCASPSPEEQEPPASPDRRRAQQSRAMQGTCLFPAEAEELEPPASPDRRRHQAQRPAIGTCLFPASSEEQEPPASPDRRRAQQSRAMQGTCLFPAEVEEDDFCSPVRRRPMRSLHGIMFPDDDDAGSACSARRPLSFGPGCSSPPDRATGRRRPSDEEEDEVDFQESEGRLARDFSDFKSIGKGQFSTVVRARNKLDGCLYAVKKTTRISRGLREWHLQEVRALGASGSQAGGCRNIVRYFSSWIEDSRLHIQTELCECSLRDHMEERASLLPCDVRFSEEDLVEVLKEVSSGLTVLHSRNFAHLDIKPDNILVSRGPQACYKIADLGLAAAAEGSTSDDVSEGDCRYLAKEVLRGDLSRLTKADVFALGLVCYEVATNPKALPCNGDEWHALRSGQLDVTPLPPLRESLVELLHQMVHPSSADRPTCEDICQHTSVSPDQELQDLEQELRQRTLEAERQQQLADGYRTELLRLKQQDIANGSAPCQPTAGGRPVASPAAALMFH